MKRIIYNLLIVLCVGLAQVATAQNFVLHRFIMVTDTIDDGGVFVAVSSDDAEQENDEMDSLTDDDLDAGWEGAPEDQNVLSTGLRFRNIFIPHGAIIDSAFLVVYSHEGKSAEDIARITIFGEATDNALTFTEEALITDRPRTDASLLWEVAEEWEIWQPYRTPDIGAIIQEITDRSGWVSGNALSLFLLGENQGLSDFENAREFESFENIADPEDGGDGQNHPERRPQLLVYYSVSNATIEIPIAVTDTIEDNGVLLAVSSDDAEQENDEMDSLTDDDLDAGWEGAPEDQNILTTGLRFRGIPIPRGAVVNSAYIQVWSHEGKSAEDVARITITGEADDNAQTYTEDALITDRPRTNAEILWEVAEEWEIWEMYQTPDIKDIVQEIIDRDNWEAGNAIAFMLLGENQGLSDFENAREFESYENIADPEDGGDGQNHPERRPRLVISFSSPSTSVFSLSGPEAKPLKVFPNPASSDLANIELDAETAAVVKLYDANGRLCYTVQSDFGRNIALPINNLVSGVYHIQAFQSNQWYVQKLIIK